jgi:sorbitol-specific phosphotransferase system component IIA
MGSAVKVPPLGFAGLLSVPLLAGLTLFSPLPLQAQDLSQPDGLDGLQPSSRPNETLTRPTPTERGTTSPVQPTPQSIPQPEPVSLPQDPEDLRRLAADSTLLSMEAGQRLIAEAKASAAAQEYEPAVTKLQQSREIFNQLSNFHQQLYTSFSGIDNRIANSHRSLAAETAQMRDEASYELAVVHSAQNKADLAVPLLIQIVGSQQPTRDLGRQAYQLLSEIGFVEILPNPDADLSADAEAPMPVSPEEPRPVSQRTGLLSIEAGNRLIEEARQSAGAEQYEDAVSKLQRSREIFNQLSNFYQQLFTSFSGIDNATAENHRILAAETAEMRDLATYELALVHRVQNQPALAVPLLIQIIRSQQPTRELGKKAYEQLWELGFVDSPFPGGRQSSSGF